MKIIAVTLWGVFGAIFGAVDGAVFGWALAWPLTFGAQIGAAVGGFVGIVYSLLTPSKRKLKVEQREITRFNLESCAWCKGSGTEGKKVQKPCSVCRGRRQLLAEIPSQPCRSCKGKGRASMGRKCQSCDGGGWASYALLDKTVTRSRK